MPRQFFITLLIFFILSLHFPIKVFGNSFLQDLPKQDGIYIKTTDKTWIRIKPIIVRKFQPKQYTEEYLLQNLVFFDLQKGSPSKEHREEYEYTISKYDLKDWGGNLPTLDYRKFQGILIKGIENIKKIKKSSDILKIIKLKAKGVIVWEGETREDAVKRAREYSYDFREGYGDEKLIDVSKEFHCLTTKSYLYCEPRDKNLFYRNLYNFTRQYVISEDEMKKSRVRFFLKYKEVYVEDWGCFLIPVSEPESPPAYIEIEDAIVLCLTGKPGE